ncbi:MAG: carboxylesterase family protein [Bacteroidaceae bacterium]|nr:carboxylesterase family protein [Bacteroidaceae bacterium]
MKHIILFGKWLTVMSLFVCLGVSPLRAQEDNTASSEKAEKPKAVADMTFTYAIRESDTLKLDIYHPAAGSETTYRGKQKPTILFVFGGGFIGGSRDDGYNREYYHKLINAGYRVVAIDYRLGLKGVHKMGVGQAKVLQNAIMMGAEDLLAATLWLTRYGSQVGLDASNIVLLGSSAGAIVCMQTIYELSNHTRPTQILPKDFHYAGVMSFAGAVFSTKGKLRFKEPPCPTLMMHGTSDKLVVYDRIQVLSVGFFGSNSIAERYKKYGYPLRFYRHKDHGHEIASIIGESMDEINQFIEEDVMDRQRTFLDVTLESKEIPVWNISADDVYK